jgi:hypothetical protein
MYFINKVPIKDITTCPAVIFAAKRKQRVNGRNKILINSIITIIGLNIRGVPVGSNLAKKVVKDRFIEDMINANHKGIPKEKVKRTWEEFPKEYGIIPIKLIKITIRKIGTKRVTNPLTLINVVWFACLFGALFKLCIRDPIREGLTQKITGKLIINIKFNNQNVDPIILKYELVVGSNVEKISIIILINNFIYLFFKYMELMVL